MAQMAEQEIVIYLRNMIGCFEFLMADPVFWHNQTYKPCYIYNRDEQKVYNKMLTSI